MDLFGEPEAPASPPTPDISPSVSSVDLEPEPYLKHPREMTFCKAHDAFEAQMLDLFTNGTMPHSVILSGPKGVGKATMAYRLAKFLLHNGDYDAGQGGLFGDAPSFNSLDIPTDSDAFNLVSASAHPDLFAVERQYDAMKNKYKNAVDVDEIRKIAPFFRKTASYGGWRIVIVDDADTMTRSAQNAILKILEEPPQRALIVLIAHNMGALVSTIRSRTQIYHFDMIAPDIMYDMLSMEAVRDIDQILELAEGSMSQALEYAGSGATDVLRVILQQIASTPRWSEIHKIADEMGGRGADHMFLIFERMSLWIFEQAAKCKARGKTLPESLAPVHKVFQQLSLDQILKICDKLGEHFTKTKMSNLDKKQAVLQAFALMAP